MPGPLNEHAHARSHLSFFGPLPHLSPDRRGAGSQAEWNLLSDDVKDSLQRAESNLNALNTVDLGPKRPFSVGECELWARLSGPRFAGQVAAAVSLVEIHSNCGKAAAVAKEVMAIMLGSKTGLSIEKFLESPFAGKHPKLIKKGTKAAAAEAAVTAAEAIAVADLEEAKRLAAEFEGYGRRRPRRGDRSGG